MNEYFPMYLAIGFDRKLDAYMRSVAAKVYPSFLEDLGGHIAAMDYLLQHSRKISEIDKHFAKLHRNEYSGVYEYEVVEPMGEWIFEFGVKHGRMPTGKEIEEEAEQHTRAFWEV